MFCTQEAVYHFLGKAIEDTPAQHIPHSLESKGLTLNANVNLAEVCNGVIAKFTNETLTNYSKVINSPSLCRMWLKSMHKESGNIAQSNSDGNKINVKGTNTVKILTHEEIKAIPKDRQITYVRIVVDYCP